MKLQATIFVLTFPLCLAGQAKAQSSEQAKTLVAGIQDLCWSPEGRYIYFSGMWHKPDYSDYHPGKWSVYRYDFTTKTTTMFADSALNVAVVGTGNKIAIGKLVNDKRRVGSKNIFTEMKTGFRHNFILSLRKRIPLVVRKAFASSR